VLPLRRFVVEHPKSARQFLKTLGLPLPEIEFEVLDEHSKADDLDRIVRWMDSGGDVGLLSEAGCPAIADPGANLVARAHRLGMHVVPLVGPSSIVLALMASGLNGQRFAFNGYLPQASAQREARIRELEERSRRLDQTEIFIEAPYRNDQLFKAITSNCKPETMLSLAIDLTSPTEEIGVKSISAWRRSPPPQLHKRPTVFLLLADSPRSANRRRRTGDTHQ
jgi:16S rRNA (cytidine1402-2'-O)-methyltransferase